MGTISNYSGKIFLLKGLVSLLLIIATIISFKLLNAGNMVTGVNDEFKKILHPDKIGTQNDIKKTVPDFNVNGLSTGIKKVTVILCLFIGYLAITLTYSSNPAYGFQKILSFLISVVPSVIVFYYLISTLTKLRVKLFIYSLGIISVLTFSYILTVYPFDQGTIYEYRAGRWSHVIYGRTISSIAVVLLLYLFSLSDKRKIILFSFFASVAVYGTYLSAFRAGFIGVLLVGIGLLLINIKSKVKSKKILIPDLPVFSIRQISSFLLISLKLFLPFIIAAILIFTIPVKDIVTLRFDNILAIDNLKFKGDPAIHSRLEAWELSWVIIKKHPIIGTGFGGFNGYNNIEWTKMIKYPHNIILEIAVEGGVVGLLVFCSLFVVMFKNIFHFGRTVVNTSHISRFTSHLFPLTFFLFALWLAMFSKDLSSQILLWIGLAFLGLKRVSE